MFETIIILYLILIVGLFIADFITGALRGKRAKELSSKDGKKGFIFFILTLLGFVLFEALGLTIDTMITRAIGHPPVLTAQFVLCTLLFLYYCWIQGLSLAENFVDLGYPVPTKIKKYLKTNSTEDRAEDLIQTLNILKDNKDKLNEIINIIKDKE